jgi:hypothetical protein
MIALRRTNPPKKESDMRYLILIAVLVALAAASGGHLVWGDYVGPDTIVWGN